ncbi:hypothetical protein, unlikely [Trypanosoma brucei gambiense DAL972]|uniref:T. brucei spp.-specific protein n=1 Tax=Trypanosoma brucei gambiense (strain MHOM/CI/86/DAL972) TaxID=679716 RepID=C9ZY12_TRYB9|nr:hypothetical protein, unlikely [Trypanosoma brucei gambiense DAL972]CBH14307.1 hypothetical protein, unlikely [Trypanosoma brucei gambiense DAL972]|eukprot:XP_011776577.1 hypothetical protein, unlikely [Trypanosoma brucei gambiense DAL972]
MVFFPLRLICFGVTLWRALVDKTKRKSIGKGLSEGTRSRYVGSRVQLKVCTTQNRFSKKKKCSHGVKENGAKILKKGEKGLRYRGEHCFTYFCIFRLLSHLCLRSWSHT